MRVTSVKRLFSLRLRKASTTQRRATATNGIRTDDRHPVVGFSKFIGNAILAPVGMVVPQGNHLLLDGFIKPGVRASARRANASSAA